MIRVIILYLGGLLLAVVGQCVGSLLLAYPIMELWNWLMPEIFGLGTITFVEAFGLGMLSGFLVKGIGGVNFKV